jgi:hypothetical protein
LFISRNEQIFSKASLDAPRYTLEAYATLSPASGISHVQKPPYLRAILD